MIRTTQIRAGITLLFVISLIVLFLLMGATFVAIAGNFLRTSSARAFIEVRGDSSQTMLRRAFMDLARGTTNPNSVLNAAVPDPLQAKDHSILADMYAPGFSGNVTDASFDVNSGNQLIRLELDNAPSNVVGEYGGRVLTFVSNSPTANVKGISCRVFHYDVQYDASGNAGTKTFFIVPEWTNGLGPFANPPDLIGARVLVNGQPFADLTNTLAGPISETYDALDIQNAFLAGPDFDSTPWIYGSFYHFQTADYERFRPTVFQATALADVDGDGRPDMEVDNDGDGIKDSIWVDNGYPIQTDSSGRQYKALVSYMAIDLDGRFNLNVHGNGEDAQGRYTNTPAADPLLGAPAAIPLGQGYGPTEISMTGLFNAGFPDPEYVNLLAGNGTYYGRFGPAGPNGIYGAGQSEVRDPWSEYKLFGYPVSGIGDFYGSRMDTKGRYGWGFNSVFDSTGSLPISMPGIDVFPAFDDPLPLNPWDYDLVDSPFEMKLSGFPVDGPSESPLIAAGSTRPDHLFSYKELERIYRMFDLDSKFLANRLLSLAPTTLGNPDNRLRVATDSWEVPVPPSNSAVELANAIIAQATAMGVPPTALAQIPIMLAPEILQGLKMDINRPFGNGIANNPQGYVDWYTADGQGETGDQVPYPTGPVDIDISRNGQAVSDEPGVARIQFAKELYVLTLLKLQGAGDFNGEGSPIEVDSEDRKALAQWVVNVIDFRDPDSIMTPFEFDDNPFNGWMTDGSLLTDETSDGIDNDGNGLIDGADPNEQFTERVIVWGCERPELLITETIGTHDRRTEDLAIGGTASSASDDDFDSRLVPVASAFIELYAPWVAGNDSTYPAELYSGNQINLAQTTPVGGHPVWRIQFVRDNDTDNDHPHYGYPGADARDMEPDDGFLTFPNAYRHLYFVQPPAGYVADGGAEAFYPSAGFNTLLSVGQHAVIGSAGNLPVAAGDYVSTFGRRLTENSTTELDGVDLANTRNITLDPADGEVRVTDFVGGVMAALPPKTNVVVIPVDQPRSFNVSDPPGGYLVDSLGVPIPFFQIEDGLCYGAAGVPAPRDVPIDYELRQTDTEFNALKDNHTEPSFRVMYLQRLANPLVDWDPVLNPYRTVDGASINVTCYNGVTTDVDTTVPTGPSTNPDDMIRDFAAMERGKAEKNPNNRDLNPPATIDDRRLLWPEERRWGRYPPQPPLVPNETHDVGDPMFAQDLLGADQHYFSSTIYESLGIFNQAYFGPSTTVPVIPSPTNANPFTWLTWLNRPYVSQFELMLVPFKDSAHLLKTFTARGSDDPYNITAANVNGSGFAHLPNFFLQQSGGPPLPTVNMALYKLLEFVEVPSRYVGTERYFYPNPANPMPVFGLAPPFNCISRYRYPGKLNINTALDPLLWNGVMAEYASSVPAGGPFLDYATMNGSRRGAMNEFANPFRETIDPMVGVNGGLLRKGSVTDALFSYDPGLSQQAHNNSDRNAYFRYDAIQRLGNLVTTRSSVFAVWVTVGFFEVDPATGDLLPTVPAAPPTPTEPGQELGKDTGEVRRHRGFFIFDRSIPVGFEKGVDHNVERAIMVESYIE